MNDFQTSLVDIASAIRDKKNTTENIPFSQFAEAIKGITEKSTNHGSFSVSIKANSSGTATSSRTITFLEPLKSDNWQSMTQCFDDGGNSASKNYVSAGIVTNGSITKLSHVGAIRTVLTNISSSKTSMTMSFLNTASGTVTWNAIVYYASYDL